LLLAALAISATVLLIHAYSYNYVVDDAYISFRYARNLARGDGLVFNPGERVEGYTNFLWTLMVAAGLKLGLEAVDLAKVLGFTFAAATLFLVGVFYSRIFGRTGKVSWIPAFLLALSPPLAVWTLGGLETTLFAFLVTAGLLVHIRARIQERVSMESSVVLLLACLTRPEGLLFATLVFADLLISRTGKRLLLLWLVPLVAGYLPYFLWRWSYYGYLLPNTFYAKTGGAGGWGRGLAYLADFLWPAGIPVLPAFLLVFMERSRRVLLPAAAMAVWVVYVLAVGGDGLAMYRFLLPVLPVAYVLTTETLLRLGDRALLRSPAAGAVLTAALLVAAAGLTVSDSFRSPEKDFVREDRFRVQGNWVAIGKWFGAYARPGESIAVTAAGAIPYYSGLYTIDMLGINDEHIAHSPAPEMGRGIAGHEKYDMEYVLSRQPTYIIHYPFVVKRPVITRDQFETPWNPGLARLPEMPRFLQAYEPVSEPIAGLHLNFFRLKK
jgi:hypothetical protein